MAQLPAFAVDGGTVPASMARRMTHAVSSGANGIVGVSDFKVTALPTAGSGVRIARGGALCRARTTGANQYETYVIAQDSTFNLTVPATGGSARTDYVIARVKDWHFTGDDAPANPTTALYWEFALVNSLSGITTPYVPLAKLTIPANTSAITNGMITDVREVAIPRRERWLYAYDLSTGQEDTLSANESWPDIGGFTVTVPEWATAANIVVTFAQIRVPAGSTRTGHLNARLRVNGIDVESRTTKYNASAPTADTRQTFIAAGDVAIPAGMRGQTGMIYSRGTIQSGSGGYIVLDSGSAVAIDIEFFEQAI